MPDTGKASINAAGLLLPALLLPGLFLLVLLLPTTAAAHHSYADYLRDESFEFSGTITEVLWANPHIIFTVTDNNAAMRVEWITTVGANRTGVSREQLAVGNQITVTGSRNRDPDKKIMTLVSELAMPGHDWLWVSPSQMSTR